MKHENCIFVSEDDCPKDKIHLTCEECFKNQYQEVINQAVKDFTGLGASFTKVFEVFRQLIAGNGKTIALETPVQSMHSISRAITAIFGNTSKIGNEKIYQRLMFYFFHIIIDEFEEEEYKENQYLH